MTDFAKLGARLRAELKKRAVHPDADVHRVIEEFQHDVGARVLYSEGDGDVSILIPLADGYEGPKRIEVALSSDTTDVIAAVPKQEIVEIEGVGKFNRYVIEPLRYQKRADGAELAIRGDGWSPLGFDGWFWEDLRLLVDLARRDDAFEVRPDVEIDPRDPSWTRLPPPQRSALEEVLGRVLPEVVHVSTLEEALERGEAQNGALSTALAGIKLALAPEQAEAGTTSDATPLLSKLYGEGAFDATKPFTRPILELAENILLDRGRDKDATPIRLAIRGEKIPEELLSASVGRALGVGFAKSRQLSKTLVDQTITRLGAKLPFEDVEALRDLLAELDHRAQVELLGEELADKPLSTRRTDAGLKQLIKELKGRTGVDDGFVFELASRIQSVINVPKKQPQVIIVSGERGPGVEQVLARVFDSVGKPLVIRGDELRLDDPVGYLVGSPAGEVGAAKGRLIAEGVESGERMVCRIDSLEQIAANVAEGPDRARSARNFYSLMAQLATEGTFRGFDPEDPERRNGAPIELGGGLLILTTQMSAKQLKEQMSGDVWDQLGVHVLETKPSDASALATELADAIRQAVMRAGDYPDAQVELGERAKAMVRDLLNAGMKPAQLARTLTDFLVDRVGYAALEGSLSPKLRIDLHRGLTSNERAEVIEAWSEGRIPSLAGIGGCPFQIFDEGRFEGARAPGISAKIVKEQAGERKELQRLRELVGEYQVALTSGDKEKAALLLENERLAQWLSAAETRIDDGKILNMQLAAEKKDLQHLNKIANATIGALQKDVATLNGRVEQLNLDLERSKSAAREIKQQLEVAIAERDRAVRTLRSTEEQFERAVRSIGDQSAARSPNDVFRQIVTSTGSEAGRYQRPMLEQMHLVATSQALQQAGQLAHSFNKWPEITEMASNYRKSCAALGVPEDARVMQGFSRAAELSGNGRERSLRNAWQRDVGGNVAVDIEDPNIVGYLLRQLARRGRIRL